MGYYQDKVVWITGASSGIGEALAKELYQRGAKLALSGRNQQALNDIAKSMDQQRVFIEVFDVTDEAANQAAVSNILQHYGQIDMAILNAGISQHANLQNFAKGFAQTITVNVLGIAYALDPLLKYFLKRGEGHIAAVSSLAGFGGLPGAEAYSASKAAVRSMLQGLTAAVADTNIVVSTICPGFVATPLTAKNDFSMPFIMNADKSANIIADNLAKRKKLICFPWLFSWFVRFLNILPNSLYIYLISRYKR